MKNNNVKKETKSGKGVVLTVVKEPNNVENEKDLLKIEEKKAENENVQVIDKQELEGRQKLAELAVEIRFIDAQIKKTALSGYCQIGADLAQAKNLVKHGEWANWLKNEVDYSQRTANNYMQLFHTYGESGLLNSQSIANLGYAQAMKLLVLDTNEIEDFVDEKQASSLSVSKLQSEIEQLKKEKDADVKKTEILLAEKNQLEKRKADLEEEKKLSDDYVHELIAKSKKESADLDALKKNTDKEVNQKIEEALRTAKAENESLKKQLSENEDEKNKIVEQISLQAEEKAKEEALKKFGKDIKDLEMQLSDAEKKTVEATELANKEATEKYEAEKVELQKKLAEVEDAKNKLAGEVAESKKKIEVMGNEEMIRVKVILDNIQIEILNLKENLKKLYQGNPEMAEKLRKGAEQILNSINLK